MIISDLGNSYNYLAIITPMIHAVVTIKLMQ